MINWMEVWETTYRAFISLAVLFLVTKMLGKKQVSQLSLFDYVIGISIGNFAAEMTINMDSAEINGIVAVLIFGIVAYVINYLTMKSMLIRRFFIGVPTVIIQDGKLNYKNMKKLKLDVNDLLEQARINGYFDISQINYALMEANGILSFHLKNDYNLPTNKDLKIKNNDSGICANIIIDGKIMENNILNMNKKVEWVQKQIKVMGYKLDNILLATLDENDKIKVFEKIEINNKEVLE